MPSIQKSKIVDQSIEKIPNVEKLRTSRRAERRRLELAKSNCVPDLQRDFNAIVRRPKPGKAFPAVVPVEYQHTDR